MPPKLHPHVQVVGGGQQRKLAKEALEKQLGEGMGATE